MTTQQTDWTIYTGSDEQIAELLQADKFIVDSDYSQFKNPSTLKMPTTETYVAWLREQLELCNVTAYWIIPDDPLREMKIRQAQTGQPVWVRVYTKVWHDEYTVDEIYATTTPDWNIPNAEYSFTPWED